MLEEQLEHCVMMLFSLQPSFDHDEESSRRLLPVFGASTFLCAKPKGPQIRYWFFSGKLGQVCGHRIDRHNHNGRSIRRSRRWLRDRRPSAPVCSGRIWFLIDCRCRCVDREFGKCYGWRGVLGTTKWSQSEERNATKQVFLFQEEIKAFCGGWGHYCHELLWWPNLFWVFDKGLQTSEF